MHARPRFRVPSLGGPGGACPYARGVNRRLAIPLVPMLALALWAGASAQDDAWWSAATTAAVDPALPFEAVRAPDGETAYVLGLNRFTTDQIVEFLAGLEAFVARAETVDPGVQLVWRLEGTRGYLSVSTSPFVGGPEYLMTLRGEPVRTFEDTAALLTTMTRLGLRVLGLAPFAHEGAAGADSPVFPAP